MSGDDPFSFEGDPLVVSDEDPITPSSVFAIAPNEISNEIKKADGGDLKSILRLRNYYTYYKYNKDEAHKWLIRAGKAGDVSSQVYIVDMFIEKNEIDNARLWVNILKDNNYQHIESLLQKIVDKEKEVKP